MIKKLFLLDVMMRRRYCNFTCVRLNFHLDYTASYRISELRRNKLCVYCLSLRIECRFQRKLKRYWLMVSLNRKDLPPGVTKDFS
jgi:hypothetical protein